MRNQNGRANGYRSAEEQADDEGAGVRLMRGFGSQQLAYIFDPFLLFDDFGLTITAMSECECASMKPGAIIIPLALISMDTLPFDAAFPTISRPPDTAMPGFLTGVAPLPSESNPSTILIIIQ